MYGHAHRHACVDVHGSQVAAAEAKLAGAAMPLEKPVLVIGDASDSMQVTMAIIMAYIVMAYIVMAYIVCLVISVTHRRCR